MSYSTHIIYPLGRDTVSHCHQTLIPNGANRGVDPRKLIAVSSDYLYCVLAMVVCNYRRTDGNVSMLGCNVVESSQPSSHYPIVTSLVHLRRCYLTSIWRLTWSYVTGGERTRSRGISIVIRQQPCDL